MLLEGGEGPARFKRLRHVALHWCRWTEHRECHNPSPSARPIVSSPNPLIGQHGRDDHAIEVLRCYADKIVQVAELQSNNWPRRKPPTKLTTTISQTMMPRT